MLCPANLLGYLRAIRLVQTGATPYYAVIPSGVPRFFPSRGVCAARGAVEESLFDVTRDAASARELFVFRCRVRKPGVSKKNEGDSVLSVSPSFD